MTTGSGIGPALGHLLTDTQGSRLVWVTRNPRTTYGEGLVDEVIAAQPQAVIWNTDEQGKPDVLALTYEAYMDSGADAVICISNRQVAASVVGEPGTARDPGLRVRSGICWRPSRAWLECFPCDQRALRGFGIASAGDGADRIASNRGDGAAGWRR